MSAVSFTTVSFSPNQVPAASAPRSGEGVIAAVKSSAVASETSKPIPAEHSAGAAGTKAPISATSKAELEIQVRDLQVKMDKLNPALAFVVDQSSGRALIQLTDRNTKEVIQQFPTVAAMQISKALDRFEKGQLINKVV